MSHVPSADLTVWLNAFLSRLVQWATTAKRKKVVGFSPSSQRPEKRARELSTREKQHMRQKRHSGQESQAKAIDL